MKIFLSLFVSFVCVCSLQAQSDSSDINSFDYTEIIYSDDIVIDDIEYDTEAQTNSTIKTTDLPFIFSGMQPNVIIDSTNSLYQFFTELRLLQIGLIKTKVRVVHVGDSHVRSHEFTPALNAKMAEIFGEGSEKPVVGYKNSGIAEESGLQGIVSHCIGINGATSKNFLTEEYTEKIKSLSPDLIIISLGTNESMGRYEPTYHYNMMKALFSALKNACPNAVFLYTTPPGAFKTIYSKSRYRRNRKIISVEENINIKQVAATIVRFAAENNVACWDLFNIVGGEKYACKNWIEADYFRPDKVHFSIAGYKLQGNLLYDALINKYNEYIER